MCAADTRELPALPVLAMPPTQPTLPARGLKPTLHPALLCRLQLSTADFQKSAELTALRRRRGGTAILIFDLNPGSAAWQVHSATTLTDIWLPAKSLFPADLSISFLSAQAGVRPGQQVLEISDPVRFNEVWTLNGLTSLKYVRQAIEGRAGETMNFCVTVEPVPEWRQAVAAARAAVGSDATTGDEPLTAAEKAEVQKQLERMQADAVQLKQSERQKKLDTRNSYYEEVRLESLSD